MQNPKRPFIAVLGGAKVSDKIKAIERLVEKADTILIGGAMANAFLNYKGYDMKSSKVESDQTTVLDGIYARASAKQSSPVDNFLCLPVDLATAKEISPQANRTIRSVNSLEEGDIAIDIGDITIERFTKTLETAGTVLWNGPLGITELPEFAHGSARVALTLATHPNITSVVGGGDPADFALKWDGDGGKSFTHVSTGGGASLDLISGKVLPGVESLLDA